MLNVTLTSAEASNVSKEDKQCMSNVILVALIHSSDIKMYVK